MPPSVPGATRVLFLGGTGILSRAAGELAIERGFDLTVLNRGWSKKRQVPVGAEVLRADVREPGALAAALGERRFDVVVDFVAFSREDVERDLSVFADRVGHYFLISTVDAYDKPPRHLPIRESTPLRNPYWSYGSGKIAAEEALTAAYREAGFPGTIVRPGHTYDETHIPLAGEWTPVARMLEGHPVVVHGDGSSLWTLTHTRDFAAALVGLFGDPAAVGESFHITSDEILSWDAITRIVGRAFGAEPDIVHVPSDAIAAASPALGADHFGDRTYSHVFDNSKIKEFVPGWRATTPFARGVREVAAWYAAHPERQKPDPELNALFDQLVERYRVDG